MTSTNNAITAAAIEDLLDTVRTEVGTAGLAAAVGHHEIARACLAYARDRLNDALDQI